MCARFTHSRATVASVVVVVVLLFVELGSVTASNNLGSGGGGRSEGGRSLPLPVPRARWENTSNFVKRLFVNATAVVFEDSPARSWPALTKWSHKYLLDIVGPDTKLGQVMSSTQSDIVLQRCDPPLFDCSLSSQTYRVNSSLSAQEFFAQLEKESRGESAARTEYLYYSVPVELMSTQLKDDVGPSYMFTPKETPRIQPQMYIWLGSDGVSTHLHYDASENFHFQITGSKTFRLYPSSDFDKLYLYPRFHPRFRRSQVTQPLSPSASDSEAFPAFEQAVPFEVTLEAGQALYIPPQWAHHVTNHGAAISVNMWMDTSATKFAETLLGRLPKFSTFEPHVRLTAFRRFLHMFLVKVLRLGGGKESDEQEGVWRFIDGYLSQRYRSLKLEGGNPAEHGGGGGGGGDQEEPPLIDAGGLAPPVTSSVFARQSVSEEAIARFCSVKDNDLTLPVTKDNLESLLAMSIEGFGAVRTGAPRTLALWDYLDVVGAAAVGTRAVPLFYEHCFRV